MIRDIRHLVRIVAIGRALARHDALFVLEGAGALRFWVRLFGGRPRADSRGLPPGRRLAEALQDMGPTFIKLGQTLATRSDLIGEEMAEELSALQDRLPPFPAAEARRIVAAELDSPVERQFLSFDDRPVAAASIAQVHFAVTAEGEEVAVKVLRPGIEERVARDVDLLAWLARWAERLVPKVRRLRLVDSVQAFQDTVDLEMDLRYEAAAAAEMADNFADDEGFRVPAVDWQRTSRRVLTLERVRGIRIDDQAAIRAAGHDIDTILAHASNAFFNMVFRDVFFHADLHPGNLFVGEHGEVIAVDFGITGRVDATTRRFLGEMLLGFMNRDFRRVAQVHFALGFVPPEKSLDAFTQACRSIGEPILERPMAEISIARLLGQLFEVTETFAMRTQPQLLLLQKTMLVAEGVGRSLNPSVNMWEVTRPLIERWMAENLGVGARVRESVEGLVGTFEGLPRLLRDAESTVTALREGGVRLHPDSLRALGEQRAARAGLPQWLPWLLVAVMAALLFLRR